MSDVRDVREGAPRPGRDGELARVGRGSDAERLRQHGRGTSDSARARGSAEREKAERDSRGRLGHVDLVYGGFPCQDVSVAGKRAGLGGERSGLWFEFARVVSELRPRWVVIENVPGLLSSNAGRDFATILDGLDELGFDAAWAVLDAQHFGVPQRRRRVFVVAGPRGRGPEQVLHLCESCGGNPETGRPSREGTTGSLSAGTLRAGGVNGGNNPAGGYIADVAFALSPARGTGDGHGNAWNSTYVANPLGSHHRRDDLDHDTYVPDLAYALAARNAKGVSLLESQDTFVAPPSGVRRLTPLECERLQGIPDGWTDGISDSHRYRMLGNAVAVPVAEWIGHRLVLVDSWGREVER